MKRINRRITFLGAGNMGSALMRSFVKSGIVKASNITASDVNEKQLKRLKDLKIKTTNNNIAAVKSADIIFLAVKPQQIDILLAQIGWLIQDKQLIVSIAAGVTTKYIEKFISKGVPVIRTMPNTPASIGLGATGIAKGGYATSKDVSVALSLFEQAGSVAVFPESKIDAVTALSGSGPAYVFYIAEAMQEAAVKLGIDKKIAEKFARQTILGAGNMLDAFQNIPASQLRKNVTSPGGTTEAALKVMESKKVKNIFAQAMKRARDRARELKK